MHYVGNRVPQHQHSAYPALRGDSWCIMGDLTVFLKGAALEQRGGVVGKAKKIKYGERSEHSIKKRDRRKRNRRKSG